MLNKKERWKTNLFLTIYGLIKPIIDFKPLIKPVERFFKARKTITPLFKTRYTLILEVIFDRGY